MVRKMTDESSKRGSTSKIESSEGCGENSILSVILRCCDVHKLGGDRRNSGLGLCVYGEIVVPLMVIAEYDIHRFESWPGNIR